MIVFKDPPRPSSKGPHAKTVEIIRALQSRPGEWALIKEDVSAATGGLWNRRPGIEARTSSIGKANGRYDVYARWVGDSK